MDTHHDHIDYGVESVSSSVFGKDACTSLGWGSGSDSVGKDTEAEFAPVGMRCDVKNLWEGRRKCTCCVNWVEEYPKDVQPNPEETGTVRQFALIVRYRKSHGSNEKAMTLSSIVVQSPLLKPVLEEVFEGYAGITATLKKVTFSAPFAPFFYRWAHFKKIVEDIEDDTTHAHAQLLYNVLFKELEETISTYQDHLSHGVITYDTLWTLFKPGDLIFCQLHGEDMTMKLGYATCATIIKPFEGTRAITDLDTYPIQFNDEAAAIMEELSIRGKKFEKLQGCHYKLHKGYALLNSAGLGRRPAVSRYRTVDGRIVVHAEMYNRYNSDRYNSDDFYISDETSILEPLNSTSFAYPIPFEMEIDPHNRPMTPTSPAYDPSAHSRLPRPPRRPRVLRLELEDRGNHVIAGPGILSDELYHLCAPIVKGYCMKSKDWAKFKVDNVQEIVWDHRAFDNLVLPPGYKDLILSFTKNQNPHDGIVNDVIEGKGQGIVMLLNGEAGVGKTLTAESVAEHMRVPLYSMSAAQLGASSREVEQALGDILEMTTKWGAILLLDECEVFLEQRTIDGLERNKLVSIFLRMLEYYRGVLFLTTNRVAVLDKALESRIHLKIVYPALDQAARLRVWQNLVDRLPRSAIGLDASDIEALSRHKINGREINNVIKAAQLLASGQDTTLCSAHIDTVLRITQIGGNFGGTTMGAQA
ncbi:P-loop containing nucleoside triphosphate hydrolase protein [Pleomassaria siparia CBS 279.74]|uniref:P-loop containing nucleoside triphosphate hydrolase protein n=1 Tax=Pleomassaria siparia CBS 279.74 TaxID=1314801 RepID=A0A6G1KNE6_9PLEO|nr:P-loop containing nucleoside triphosphate hydrolase protein [Pleomassaria siparia CBS 279.74]